MNAIGAIGKLIIRYQDQIEIALLALLGAIIIFWILQLVVRSVRTKDVLEEINTKVSDIDSKVTEIQSNRTNISHQSSDNSSEHNDNERDVLSSEVDIRREATPQAKKVPHMESSAIEQSEGKCDVNEENEVLERNNAPRETFVQSKIPNANNEERMNELKMWNEELEISNKAKEKNLDLDNFGAGAFMRSKITGRTQIDESYFENQLQHVDGYNCEQYNMNRKGIKYYKRDSAIDKHGNVYTEEELRMQIG